MKSKKIMAVFIIAIIITSSVFTAYGEAEIKESKDNYNIIELSIEEAMLKAIENSTTLSSIDRNIESLEDALGEQKDLQENAEDITKLPIAVYNQVVSSIQNESNEPEYLTILLLKNGYGVESVRGQLEILEKKRLEAKEGIETATKVAYYNALIASKSVEINKQALENAEKKLEDANRKYEVGTITSLELLKEELAVNQAMTNLSNSEAEYKVKMVTLKNAIGYPLKQEIHLISDVDNNISKDINLEAAVLVAKENRVEVLEAEKKIITSQIKYDSYKSYYTSSSKLSNVYNELLDAKYDLQTVYSDIELDVMKKFFEIEENEKSLEHIDETISLLQESLRITKLFYKHGMATSADVLQVQTDLNNAIIGKYKLNIAYEISLIMFENCLD